MKILKGKTAIITGATRGIGRGIAEVFAKQGANVLFTYSSSSDLAKEIEDNLSKENVIVKGYKSDASNFEDCQKLVDQISEEFDTVDILINNAGITRDNLLMRMQEEDFDKVINTNLKGTYFCTKACVPSMIKNRWGRIINITSVVGIRGNIGQSNYSASKGAIHSFTYSLAKELATRGITVNAIAPGYIQTATVDVLSDKLKDHIMTWIPMNRFGTPDEISGMAAFMASEKAKYMTGEVVRIDGGMAI